MKTILICLAMGMMASDLSAQDPTKNKSDLFFDIESRAPFTARYDSTSRTLYNTSTGRPVDFFINSKGDTVSARGFYIVNNYLLRNNNTFQLDNERSIWRGEKLWDSRSQSELMRDRDWELYTQPPRRDSL